MAGDLEDRLADALADIWMRTVRLPAGLAKAQRPAVREVVRKAAREVLGETVTPALVRVASLTERLEFLEEQRAKHVARYGGGA